jgi:hypothetical protein
VSVVSPLSPILSSVYSSTCTWVKDQKAKLQKTNAIKIPNAVIKWTPVLKYSYADELFWTAEYCWISFFWNRKESPIRWRFAATLLWSLQSLGNLNESSMIDFIRLRIFIIFDERQLGYVDNLKPESYQRKYQEWLMRMITSIVSVQRFKCGSVYLFQHIMKNYIWLKWRQKSCIAHVLNKIIAYLNFLISNWHTHSLIQADFLLCCKKSSTFSSPTWSLNIHMFDDCSKNLG